MNDDCVFITIGFPEGDIPIVNLTKVSLGKLSAKDAAKKLRKEIAENPKDFAVYGLKPTPAEMYWAVFNKTFDQKPFMASDNYFCREALRKEAYEKAQKELEEYVMQGSYGKTSANPDDAKCPNCGCYGLFDGNCQACGTEFFHTQGGGLVYEDGGVYIFAVAPDWDYSVGDVMPKEWGII
jgi:hypothetical protein